MDSKEEKVTIALENGQIGLVDVILMVYEPILFGTFNVGGTYPGLFSITGSPRRQSVRNLFLTCKDLAFHPILSKYLLRKVRRCIYAIETRFNGLLKWSLDKYFLKHPDVTFLYFTKELLRIYIVRAEIAKEKTQDIKFNDRILGRLDYCFNYPGFELAVENLLYLIGHIDPFVSNLRELTSSNFTSRHTYLISLIPTMLTLGDLTLAKWAIRQHEGSKEDTLIDVLKCGESLGSLEFVSWYLADESNLPDLFLDSTMTSQEDNAEKWALNNNGRLLRVMMGAPCDLTRSKALTHHTMSATFERIRDIIERYHSKESAKQLVETCLIPKIRSTTLKNELLKILKKRLNMVERLKPNELTANRGRNKYF